MVFDVIKILGQLLASVQALEENLRKMADASERSAAALEGLYKLARARGEG